MLVYVGKRPGLQLCRDFSGYVVHYREDGSIDYTLPVFAPGFGVVFFFFPVI